MRSFRPIAALMLLLLTAILSLIETRAGLPNTCTECGTLIADTWHAPTLDAARAGQGRCADCAGVKPATPTSQEADHADHNRPDSGHRPGARRAGR